MLIPNLCACTHYVSLYWGVKSRFAPKLAMPKRLALDGDLEEGISEITERLKSALGRGWDTYPHQQAIVLRRLGELGSVSATSLLRLSRKRTQ